jgi:hypothetical protein
MRQLMRQIGLVVGLTVLLTFPVTVVSGAGSQKQTDHVFRFSVGGKGQGKGAVVALTKKKERAPLRLYPIISEGLVDR